MSDLGERLQAALGDAFRLERELAAGGMSRLFLATEASLNRSVVVKVLPPEFTSDVSAARFKQEIEVAAHLQHPHVLPLLNAGAKDDLLFYVMPYVAGESLRHRLAREGKIPVATAARILYEVADALAYAHARGVIHRDIKPENILLEEDHAVLTDFGVARALSEARSGGRLTGTGMALGTPGYMSPEQAAGDSHIDARADLYALAVVGYEMLAGAPPFEGSSPQAVLAAHLTKEVKPLAQTRSDTPPELAVAITKALAKDPAQRFRSAAEFRDAIPYARTGQQQAALAAPRRRRRLVTAAILLVVAGVSLWWATRSPAVEGDPRKSLVVFPFENRTGTAQLDWMQEGAMHLLDLTLAHWQDLRVFDDERTSSLMRRRGIRQVRDLDFDAAQRMAREARVGTLVLGDFRREGDSLVLEAKVHDVASGERLATEIVRAPATQDPRPLLDSLAARLLRVSGAPPGLHPGAVAQTTRSLQAYQLYLAGTAAMFRLDLDSAQRLLERAIALDTTFALAYLQLGHVHGWRAISAEKRELSAKALRYGAALPPRLRTLIEIDLATYGGEQRRARRMAEELIARDSGDVEAWDLLGESHFHHGAFQLPHPDTLGNAGKALKAFERSLALDSTYLISYPHIPEILNACASPASPFVCVADSAAYGDGDALRARFGQPALDRLRADARDQMFSWSYRWVAATPGSAEPLARLIRALIRWQRFNEASNQIGQLRALGRRNEAAAYEAQALLSQRRFRDAAGKMREALVGVPDSALLSRRFVFEPAGGILAAAGAVREGRALTRRVVRSWALTGGSWPGTDGQSIAWPRQTEQFGLYFDVAILAQYAADGREVRQQADRLFDLWRRIYAPDTATMRRSLGRLSLFLTAYLASRDTAILARWLASSDSVLWPSALAELALARGDTATARGLVTRHYRATEPIKLGPLAGLNLSEDVPEAFAWADLLGRLGDARRAVEAYARLDSAPYDVRFNDWNQGLLIRSWLERGALYERLGDRPHAIEMYRKLVDAWGEGDEYVRPALDRARAGLARLGAPS